MPIYEYVCNACGNEFEAIQKFSDAPLTTGECGHEGSAARKLSLAAFQLKGGGWYKEGYHGGSTGNGSAPAPTPASDSGSSDSGSSAAAPAHGCGGACACG